MSDASSDPIKLIAPCCDPLLEDIPTFCSCPRILFPLNGILEFTEGKCHRKLHSGELTLIPAYRELEVDQHTGHFVILEMDMDAFQKIVYPDSRITLSARQVSLSPEQLRFLHSLVIDYLRSALDTDYGMSGYRVFQIEMQILSVLAEQFQHKRFEVRNTKDYLETAIEFINQNYQRTIRIKDIAKSCHLSESYLTHLFTEQTGYAPMEYLLKIRLANARKQLSNPGTRIWEVAEYCGFGTARNMNSAFKKQYGLLPRDWQRQRGQVLQKSVKSGDTFFQELQKLFLLQHGALETIHSELETDCSSDGIAMPNTWFSFLEYQDTVSLLSEKGRSILRSIQKMFSFENIILWNMFDMRILPYYVTEDHIHWDFSQMDSIFDFLLSINLRPFLTITNIPEALVSSDGEKRFFTTNVGIPTDLCKWDELIKQLCIHLREQYNSLLLKQWNISIWVMREIPLTDQRLSDADGSGGNNDLRDFCFYNHTYRIIRQFLPEIKIWSPFLEVMERTYSRIYLKSFLSYCQRNECMPDGFLCHTKQLQEQSGTEVVCEFLHNPDCAGHVRILENTTHQIRCAAGRSLPVIFPNWRMSFNEVGDLFFDTVYCSAVTASFFINSLGRLDAVGCPWPINTMASMDSKKVCFNGGKEFFVAGDIPKAAANVFPLLRLMGNRLIVQKEDCCITRREDAVQIIMINFRPYHYRIKVDAIMNNPIYSQRKPRICCFDSEEPLWTDPFARYQMLDHRKKKFSILLSGLKHNEYDLVLHILNASHGSSFDEWLRMGAPEELSGEEYQYLKEASIPLKQIRRIRTVNGRYVLEHELESMEVCLAELVPVIFP